MSGLNSDKFIEGMIEGTEHITHSTLGHRVGHHIMEEVGHKAFDVLDLDADGSISDTIPDIIELAFDFISGIFQ